MTRDQARDRARGLWGGSFMLHEETRITDEGSATYYSVGHTGDQFNWTSEGQGWSYEEAFKEAESRYDHGRRHLTIVREKRA